MVYHWLTVALAAQMQETLTDVRVSKTHLSLSTLATSKSSSFGPAKVSLHLCGTWRMARSPAGTTKCTSLASSDTAVTVEMMHNYWAHEQAAAQQAQQSTSTPLAASPSQSTFAVSGVACTKITPKNCYVQRCGCFMDSASKVQRWCGMMLAGAWGRSEA